MSFERCVPDPAMLARLMAELDIPMDCHEAMIETLDAFHREQFERDIEADPKVREEWERFIFASREELTDDF